MKKYLFPVNRIKTDTYCSLLVFFCVVVSFCEYTPWCMFVMSNLLWETASIKRTLNINCCVYGNFTSWGWTREEMADIKNHLYGYKLQCLNIGDATFGEICHLFWWQQQTLQLWWQHSWQVPSVRQDMLTTCQHLSLVQFIHECMLSLSYKFQWPLLLAGLEGRKEMYYLTMYSFYLW